MSSDIRAFVETRVMLCEFIYNATQSLSADAHMHTHII